MIVTIALMIISLWTLVYLKFKKLEERNKVFEKWIFDSLYSINPKTLLPEEHDRPMINKKATVFKPEQDPMAEFKKTGLL